MAANRPADLDLIADYMDTRFRGPFGWRFGWDGILGLVPIAGDVVTNGVSLYVVLRAAQLGCSPSVLLRMGLNLFIENLIDLIPFVGNLFDFAWKANRMNVDLVARHLADPTRTRNSSRIMVTVTVLVILSVVVGSIIGAFYLLRAVIEAFGYAMPQL